MKSHLERVFNYDIFSTVNELTSIPDELEKILNPPTRNYVQDTKAIARTTVDIKKNFKAYTFVANMPGLKGSDVKVQIENDNVLTIRGKWKREEVEEDTKISTVSQDGVLTVTVPKLPPPEPEKPKTVVIPVN
eukprot:Gb_09555 [translate_table: standard]